MEAIKNFLTNKNTVTILGIVVILAILYFGYNYQINKAIEPVSVPVASMTIEPRTEITSEMVTYVDVASKAITDNVILYDSQIIGKYSNVNTVIPSGSMFYTEAVIDKEELPNIALIKLEEGKVPYIFTVDFLSTYYNSIMPDTNVDVYMAVTTDEGKVMIGKLFSDVRVVAVKDAEGNNVFETSTASEPSALIFELTPEHYFLIKKAEYLGLTLYPVPTSVDLSEVVEDYEYATTVTSAQLEEFITSRSVAQDDLASYNIVTDKDKTDETENGE